MSRVINAARLELDGVTEPTLNGATVHAHEKRQSIICGHGNLNPGQHHANRLVWPRDFVSAPLVSNVRPDLLHIRA
ncbi:hypothetical protein [Mesorhizobium sp. URHB0026]